MFEAARLRSCYIFSFFLSSFFLSFLSDDERDCRGKIVRILHGDALNRFSRIREGRGTDWRLAKKAVTETLASYISINRQPVS